MDNFGGISIITKLMQVALSLSLMAGGLVYLQGMKKNALSDLVGKSGLLSGADAKGGSGLPLDGGNTSLLNIFSSSKKEQPWTECPLPHPGNSPSLTLMHKNGSGPKDKSECQVRFGEDDNIRRWLPLDGDGRLVLKAYWYPPSAGSGPCIRLQDYTNEYLIDFSRQKTYMLIRYAGRTFAGEISDNNPGYLTSSSTSATGKPQIHICVGNNRAEDISRTAVAKSPGMYFGTVDRQSGSKKMQFIPSGPRRY